MRKRDFLTLFLLLLTISGMGHPMPHSTFSFDVKADRLFAELKIPLNELQLAVPFDVSEHTETLLEKERKQQLIAYFSTHIRPKSITGLDWKVEVMDMNIAESIQEATGKYQELIVHLLMQPPPNESVQILTYTMMPYCTKLLRTRFLSP